MRKVVSKAVTAGGRFDFFQDSVKEKLEAMIAQHHLFFSLSFVLLFSLFIIGLYFTLYMYFFFLKEVPLKTSFAEG